MIKKEYMKPSLKVVELQHKCQILAGSQTFGGSTDIPGMNTDLQDETVDEGW